MKNIISTIKFRFRQSFNRARRNPKLTIITAILDFFLAAALSRFHHDAWALIPLAGFLLAIWALLNPIDDDVCPDCGEYDDDCQCLSDEDDSEFDEPA